MKQILIAAAAPLLLAVPVGAAPIDRLDTDGDGMLSLDEFAPAIEKAGWFAEWNKDGDDTISLDEFRTSLFGQFDDDSDGQLSQEEWQGGFQDWPGEQRWTELDDDGNGALGPEEFHDAVGTKGLYAGLAGQDHTLSRSEFVEGVFDWYEGDDEDRLLSQAEYQPLMQLLAGDH